MKTNLNPLYVFIHPPSVDDLEKRLRGRGTETEESLQKRLSAAKAEMEFGTPDNFDKVVVNINILEKEKLHSISISKLQKVSSNT